ncbi:hypothetical protein ACWGID_13510 [Kribbella sp. NPDC054772]
MNRIRTRMTIGACALAGLLVAGIGLHASQTPAEATTAATITCALTWSTGTNPVKSASQAAANLPPLTVVGGKGYINAPAVTLPAHKTCSGGSPFEATWTAYAGTTPLGDIWFLDESQVTEYVLDGDPLGVRSWKGHLEPDAAQTDVTFVNPPDIDFRLSSTGQLASWAFGTGCATITFTAVSTRYAAKWNGYVSNTSATGSIQYRTVGSSTWTNVATFTTDAAGKAAVSRSFPGIGDYRVWMNDTAITWAGSSAWKRIQSTC